MRTPRRKVACEDGALRPRTRLNGFREAQDAAQSGGRTHGQLLVSTTFSALVSAAFLKVS